MFENWNGKILVDDVEVERSNFDFKRVSNASSIKLLASHPKCLKSQNAESQMHMEESVTYRIKVKQWMTRKSANGFNFMLEQNNDVPMPMRVMTGTKIEGKETRGMIKMRLHGDILQERTYFCMKCGKPINNPVSQFFGMGPECGGHGYVNPFDSEEELKQAVEAYRLRLQNITWEGWIAKSAIEEIEEIK